MRYSSHRSYSWSQNTAYLTGLMAGDGCLQSDNRHLDITSVDLEQLFNFQLALGREQKISKKFSGSGKQAFRIQFSDVALYDFLLSAGLHPKKSHTIQNVSVPDIFYADFLRGLFDSDGTCYAYHDPRWPTSYLYYSAFTGASLQFLQNIQVRNHELISLQGKSIRNSSRAYSLTYGKSDTRKLFDFMYYSNSVIYLSRKHTKLKGFISAESMLK